MQSRRALPRLYPAGPQPIFEPLAGQPDAGRQLTLAVVYLLVVSDLPTHCVGADARAESLTIIGDPGGLAAPATSGVFDHAFSLDLSAASKPSSFTFAGTVLTS